jgi:membrane-bound serine protease (ClpP class)
MVSFQMLPVSYGALALILIGMAMVIAEFYVTSYGVLGVGGIICFVVGSLFLIDSDSPEYQIKLSLILPIATVLSLAALFIGSLVYRSRRVVPRSGSEALVGQYSEVFETVTAESGKVFLQGEIWNAVCAPGQSYAKGTVVRVLEVKGLTLTVAAS